MDRDMEVHRLTARLRTLRRFGLDLCLGRIVRADGSEPVYVGRLGLTDSTGRQLLVDWRSKVGDPQASLVPPHVTLLPPTEVAVADRTAISAHLADGARSHPPFEMHLSGTGTFAPRLLFTSPSPRGS